MHGTEKDNKVLFIFFFFKESHAWLLMSYLVVFVFFFLPTNVVMDFMGHVLNCYSLLTETFMTH